MLASSWAQGEQFLKMRQGQNESEQKALLKDNKTEVKGSPFCPDNSFPQGWVPRQVVPSKPPPPASCLAHCPSRNPRQPKEQPSPFWLWLFSNQSRQPRIILHGQLLPPVGESCSLQQGHGRWDKWHVRNLGKGNIQVHNCRQQRQDAQHPHSQLSLLTWVEEMPPVTTILGARGGRQQNMGNFMHCCVLHWHGGQKILPFNTLANTPTFFTAPSSCMY